MLINFLETEYSGDTQLALSTAKWYKSQSVARQDKTYNILEIFGAMPTKITIRASATAQNLNGSVANWNNSYASHANTLIFLDKDKSTISQQDYNGKTGAIKDIINDACTNQYTIDVPANAVYIRALSSAVYSLSSSNLYIRAGMFVKSIEIDDSTVISNVPKDISRFTSLDVTSFVSDRDISCSGIYIGAVVQNSYPLNHDSMYDTSMMEFFIDGVKIDINSGFSLSKGQKFDLKILSNAPTGRYNYIIFLPSKLTSGFENLALTETIIDATPGDANLAQLETIQAQENSALDLSERICDTSAAELNIKQTIQASDTSNIELLDRVCDTNNGALNLTEAAVEPEIISFNLTETITYGGSEQLRIEEDVRRVAQTVIDFSVQYPSGIDMSKFYTAFPYDSVNQYASASPSSGVTRTGYIPFTAKKGDKIYFDAKVINGSYRGVLHAWVTKNTDVGISTTAGKVGSTNSTTNKTFEYEVVSDGTWNLLFKFLQHAQIDDSKCILDNIVLPGVEAPIQHDLFVLTEIISRGGEESGASDILSKEAIYANDSGALNLSERIVINGDTLLTQKEYIVASCDTALLEATENIVDGRPGLSSLLIEEDIRRPGTEYEYNCDSMNPSDLPSTINLEGLFRSGYIKNGNIVFEAIGERTLYGSVIFETFSPNETFSVSASVSKNPSNVYGGAVFTIDDKSIPLNATHYVIEKPGKHVFSCEVSCGVSYGLVTLTLYSMGIPHLADLSQATLFNLKELIDFTGSEMNGYSALGLKEKAYTTWGEEFKMCEVSTDKGAKNIILTEKAILDSGVNLTLFERIKATGDEKLRLREYIGTSDIRSLAVAEAIQALNGRVVPIKERIIIDSHNVLLFNQKIYGILGSELALTEQIKSNGYSLLMLTEKLLQGDLDALTLIEDIVSKSGATKFDIKELIKKAGAGKFVLTERITTASGSELSLLESIESLGDYGLLDISERILTQSNINLSLTEAIQAKVVSELLLKETIKQTGADSVYLLEDIKNPGLTLIETILADGYKTRLLSSNKSIRLLNRKGH